jgi:hypothetical protein
MPCVLFSSNPFPEFFFGAIGTNSLVEETLILYTASLKRQLLP